MRKFYPIGSIIPHPEYGMCLLAQVDDCVGALIDIHTGNRIHNPGPLSFDIEYLKYGAYSDSELFRDFIDTLEVPAPKPDKVQFFRYLRPRNVWGEIDSQSGVTFSIELDYVDRVARYGYSICEGENFDKIVGRSLAAGRRMYKTQPYYYEVPFGESISEQGSVSHLICALGNAYENLPPKNQRLARKLFHIHMIS